MKRGAGQIRHDTTLIFFSEGELTMEQRNVTVLQGVDGRIILVLALVGGVQVIKWIDCLVNKKRVKADI